MVDKAPGPHPSRACFMIRGETSRLSSPHGLAGQAACLSPGGAVSARSPECPEGVGTQSREGAPGRREEARGAPARGAEGRRERAGQKARGALLWVLGTGETGLPCQPGAKAERHMGCADSRLPSLCVHSSPPKGVGFWVSFFHPKSQKQFRWFHLWHHLLQQRGPVHCRASPGQVAAPRPAGPLWPESCPPGAHSHPRPLGSKLSPSGTEGQMRSAGAGAGRLVCLTFCLHLSGTVGPLSFWSPLGRELRGPRVPSACIFRGPETATALDPQRDEDSCFPEARGAH